MKNPVIGVVNAFSGLSRSIKLISPYPRISFKQRLGRFLSTGSGLDGSKSSINNTMQPQHFRNANFSDREYSQAISHSVLSDFRTQLNAPDTKSDCGIFACAYADQLQAPTLVPDMLRCPVEYLKARYHTTDGGGDGGGIIVQSSPNVLAKFYGCEERFFNGEGRLVQVSFSRDEHVRSSQEFELKSRLNELGALIVVQKTPDTNFDCLRDGKNNEKDRQGQLVHFVIEKPTGLSNELFDQKCLQLILQFNLHQKATDCVQDGYSPASIDAITRQRIVCKSFKGDSIVEMFPFLKSLKTNNLRFHGREATNTGAARFSIHPTADMNIMHNGEINNIKSLRIYLSGNQSFRDFLNWQGQASLEDVLNQFSDTAIFSMYLSFQFCNGISIENTLCHTFQPNHISYTKGFVAEGPATIMVSHANEFFLVNDSQGQRPAYLHVIKNESDQIVAYRVGSVSGIDTPLDGDWHKVQVTPGVVKKLTAIKDTAGQTLYFDMIDLSPETHEPSFLLPDLNQQPESHLKGLEPSQGLHGALQDHEVKVAMGSQRIKGPFPNLCTAGVTNTSNSLGIDPSHPDVLLYLGSQTMPMHPMLTHMEHQFVTTEGEARVIDATLDQDTVNQMIASEKGLNEVISAVLRQVKKAISEGAQTIDLRFVNNDRIPIFPRELLVNRVSKLISNLGGDGFSDSKKINLIITTHSIQHAQDAFALINMGADFVYHPHIQTETYDNDISVLRNSLMTLAMRAGVSRLSQLKNAGLIHYEGMQELAGLLGVPNMGGDQFKLTDSLKYVITQMHGVARDYGTGYNSDNQKLTMSDAVLMQNESTQAEFNRRNLVHHVYPVKLMPTEQTNLKPIIVVFGAGPAGISYIENLPENHFNIVLVEKNPLHRGGNARYIAGNHDSMYQSFNSRFQAILDRNDVRYFGGARETLRDQLLQCADQVVDARGSVRKALNESHHLTARDFLDVAYESHTSPDQVIDIPDHFKQKREFPGVLIQGVGNVSWDVLQALLCNDSRVENPSRLFEKWLTQFSNMPIYIMARRGPESLIWKRDWIHQLGERDEPFRIFCSDESQINDELKPYFNSFKGGLPTNGINLIFNSEVVEDGYEPKTGQLNVLFGNSNYKLPFIGTIIQGYVPQQSPEPLKTPSPVLQLGWSRGSGSMADIIDFAEALNLPSHTGFGSANERLKNAAKLEDLAEKYPFIGKEIQLKILGALEDRAVSDAELTKLIGLNRSISTPLNAVVSVENTNLDDLPIDQSVDSDVDEILSQPLEDNIINVFSRDGNKVIPIPYESGQSVLKTIEKNGNGATIDSHFDCGGTGSCSQCAAVVNAVKLAVPKSSEKALTNPIKKEFGAIKYPARLLCQLNLPNGSANIVAGSHLLDMILQNKKGVN